MFDAQEFNELLQRCADKSSQKSQDAVSGDLFTIFEPEISRNQKLLESSIPIQILCFKERFAFKLFP